MTIRKRSERALRDRKCKRCGSTAQFYWASTDERPRDFFYIEVNDSTRSPQLKKDGEVLAGYVSGYTKLHQAGKYLPEGLGIELCEPAGTASAPDPASWTDPEPSVVAPDPFTDPAKASVEPIPAMPSQFALTPEQEALQKLIGITPEKVWEMAVKAAKEAVAEQVFPTQTVVIKDQVEHKVEGDAHCQLAEVLSVMNSSHVYLVGPPGTGKSHIAHQAADLLGRDFFSISLTEQTPESALKGFVDAHGNVQRTPFWDAVENGGIMLVDEIDHGAANTVGFVNAATSNGVVAFAGRTMVKVHPDFRLIATANTYGTGPNRLHVGATQLDAATLDRFGMIEILYDEALESALVAATGVDTATQKKILDFVRKCRKNAVSNPSLRGVFTPRGSVRMAKNIQDGLTFERAVAISLRRGYTDADWAKLTA